MFTLVIIILGLGNGLCALVRIWFQFPAFGIDSNYIIFAVFYLLECILFYHVVWIFGFKQFEVA